MKETEKMIKFYKSRIKINIVSLSIILFLMALVAIFILANYSWLWWISLILFGLDIIFLVLLFFAVKSAKKTIVKLEKELKEAEDQTKNINREEL